MLEYVIFIMLTFFFLQPYDFLAFIPIIEGAGGIITDWAGQKLQWEASPVSKGVLRFCVFLPLKALV